MTKIMNTLESKTVNVQNVSNLLPKFGGSKVKTRNIICSPSISKQDRDGIIRLYEALVPRKEIKSMDLEGIQKIFPTFEDINIDMILEEGFPKFEETIGTENFAKIKKYFGIGSKANPNQNIKQIDSLISKLRTIENAQFYICGYKDLIIKLANLLEGNQEYTDLEKAKIIRLFAVLFFGYFYFAEDFTCYGTGESRSFQIDYTKVEKNNKLGFYPEELFSLYLLKFSETPEKNIFYDTICFELNQIEDKKLLKEILQFSELDIRNGILISVNTVNPYQNFGKIRSIKQKIHHEPGVYPIEFFSVKAMAQKLDLGALYLMYKTLKSHNLDELKKLKKTYIKFEGSRILEANHFCYEVTAENYIGGELERNRFIRLVEYFTKRGLTMFLKFDLKNGKKLKNPKKYNMGQFLGAIKFVNDANLVDTTTYKRDFEIANKLIKMDKKGALSKYALGIYTIEEVKSDLKIDEAFEFEFFGIKPKVEHKDILSNFALQNGYVESAEEIDNILIENVIIPGNEELIEMYNADELDDKSFEKELGITPEFSEMLFSLSKVDIASIEEKLLDVKKSTIGKKKLDHSLKMVILLYCYIVEGQIACGPKGRVPKRNKALKPSILKTLV